MTRKIILFFVFIFFISLNANSKSYRIGDKIRGNLEFYKKYVFDLPDGEWVVADKYAYSYYGVVSKGYILLKIKNKKAIEWINIGELDIGSRYQSIFNSILQEIVFKNKYDGCYDRPEYYVLEYFAKGSSHNCFWVLHEDVYKELNDPEDPELRGVYSHYKAWLRNNGIELPKVAIGSWHSYFSRLTGGKWFVMTHYFDPENLGAPKSKFIKEERSEYHKHNISNFPKHKKIMDKVISLSAERHKKFELEVRAKEHHKINLSSLISNSSGNGGIDQNQDIVTQINKLRDLLKSGVLTEEEFKKAKEKILN